MDCKNCKWDYSSYHCMDCKNYNGKLKELKPFCGYCNHNKGTDPCNNCVWQ